MTLLGVYGQTDTSALVGWTTDIAAQGRVLYRESGATEWLATALDPAPVTEHYHVLTDLIETVEYEYMIENDEAQSASATYVHTSWVGEIPKNQMTASASMTTGGSPAMAIDGMMGDNFWRGEANQWLRLDLSARHRLQLVRVRPRPSHRTRNFRLYVTDMDSATPADWGAPVVQGELPNTDATSDLAFFATGRYVIFYAVDAWQNVPAVLEIWLFGEKVDPTIDSFEVTDQSTGSTLFTNSATVNVTFEAHAPDGPVAGYAITETPDEPTEWLPAAPATYEIISDPGAVTLYGWAQVTRSSSRASHRRSGIARPARSRRAR